MIGEKTVAEMKSMAAEKIDTYVTENQAELPLADKVYRLGK